MSKKAMLEDVELPVAHLKKTKKVAMGGMGGNRGNRRKSGR